jgi:hypothetical protein
MLYNDIVSSNSSFYLDSNISASFYLPYTKEADVAYFWCKSPLSVNWNGLTWLASGMVGNEKVR